MLLQKEYVQLSFCLELYMQISIRQYRRQSLFLKPCKVYKDRLRRIKHTKQDDQYDDDSCQLARYFWWKEEL